MTDTNLGSAVRGRSLWDRLRTDIYLTRLDWHLEEVTTGKERRAIVRELRHELAGDPRETKVTLRDLGPVKTLAKQYGDGIRRPMWSIGVIAAGLAFLIYLVVFYTFAFGMLAAVVSVGSTEAQATFLFVDVTAFSEAGTIGIGWTSGWAWFTVPAVIVAITFILGSRLWRFTGHKPSIGTAISNF